LVNSIRERSSDTRYDYFLNRFFVLSERGWRERQCRCGKRAAINIAIDLHLYSPILIFDSG